jgi:hypothetical protein
VESELNERVPRVFEEKEDGLPEKCSLRCIEN